MSRITADQREEVCRMLDQGISVSGIERRTGISRKTINMMRGNGSGAIHGTRQICYVEGCTNSAVVGKFCAKHEVAKIPAPRLARLMAGRA